MLRAILAVGAMTLSMAGAAYSQPRLGPVPPAQFNAAQKKAAAEFEATRKAPMTGPFLVLMRSPEVMTASRMLGDHLRFNSAIGTTLSEMAILITAREWSQDYEWGVHAPIALRQGIRKEIVDAIADARRPVGMSEDETLVYDFSTELQRNKRVSDVTYAKVLKRWGETGVVDLSAISGYYTLLAMVLNVARTPGADGAKMSRLPE